MELFYPHRFTIIFFPPMEQLKNDHLMIFPSRQIHYALTVFFLVACCFTEMNASLSPDYWIQKPDSVSANAFAQKYPLPSYVPDPRVAFAENMTGFLDTLGKALVRHQAKPGENISWFYGAYALLQMENSEPTTRSPLGDLNKIIPSIWGDLKYLTMNDLIRKIDAVLTHGVTVPLYRPERNFAVQTAEERLVNYFNGMRHLQMLRNALGDSVFNLVVQTTDNSGENGWALTDTLINQIGRFASPEIARTFFQALKTSSRTDPAIKSVKTNSAGNVIIELTQEGAWNFPVTLQFITEKSDTMWLNGVWPQAVPLEFPVSAAIDKIIVDPDKQLVEINRYNNFWPKFPQTLSIQPLWGIPSWESYKIVFTPFSWRDWNETKRYGVRFSGGIGIDLMPLYPSEYRHRWMMEVSAYGSADQPEQWGVRLDYGHPLSWPQRLFVNVKTDLFKDFQQAEVKLTKYVGQSRYPFQGFQLQYHRYTASSGMLRYDNQTVWQKNLRIPFASLNVSRFMLTESGHQLHYQGTVLTGWNGYKPWGIPFSLYRGRISMGGVLGGWLRGEFSGVGGYESGAVPYAFEFTQNRGWVHSTAVIPGLQGQAVRQIPANAYLGSHVSLGYWFDTFQPKIFASGIIYGDPQIPFEKAPLEKAVGVGFEHQSFFFLGVYFPFWQSDPLPGEQQWAYRFQWKFGLYL